MRQHYIGDELRRSGSLRINFHHLGIFNKRQNLEHWHFHFTPPSENIRRSRESNLRFWAQQHIIATAPPWRVQAIDQN